MTADFGPLPFPKKVLYDHRRYGSHSHYWIVPCISFMSSTKKKKTPQEERDNFIFSYTEETGYANFTTTGTHRMQCMEDWSGTRVD